MTEFPPRPTSVAQLLLLELLRAGDVAIDATAGNGYDTVFLAERVGAAGKVLAFDVQEAAIVSAQARVAAAGFSERVEFFCESHAMMERHVEKESVTAVMFNLGYLPGADHALATGSDTLAALEAAERLLKPGGMLSVICYPGHAGGDDEAAAVERWMTDLPARGWRVAKYGAVGTKRPAPFLLAGFKG
jgi:tRNA1(Val) A37 N6-methylase TrmN6